MDLKRFSCLKHELGQNSIIIRKENLMTIEAGAIKLLQKLYLQPYLGLNNSISEFLDKYLLGFLYEY